MESWDVQPTSHAAIVSLELDGSRPVLRPRVWDRRNRRLCRRPQCVALELPGLSQLNAARETPFLCAPARAASQSERKYVGVARFAHAVLAGVSHTLECVGCRMASEVWHAEQPFWPVGGRVLSGCYKYRASNEPCQPFLLCIH